MATAKKAPAAPAPAAPAKAPVKAPVKAQAAPAAAKATPTKAKASAKAAPAVAAPAAAAPRAANSAFMKPMTPSAKLAAVIGKQAMPRTEVTKKVWEYIKKHQLQDAANKRMINADAKLQPIFGKPQVSMFEMTKLISNELS